MFPIHNMPQAIQWVTYLNPMRYFITITQGVLLKGSGIDALWPQFALLGALGVTTILFAASRFSKTEA
jgi:ABC-2 type transport system permease protein